MTGPELRALLKQLGLRQVGLAERMGVSPVTVHRWLSGDLAVPQYVVAYLECRLQLEAMSTLTKFVTRQEGSTHESVPRIPE
jgi:transcriptional regulator with XRE-family HTH domain